MTFVTGFLIYFSLSSPDVRLSKKQRTKLMRTLENDDKPASFDEPFKQT